MTGLPTPQVLIAFTTPYSTLTPTWVDVSQWVREFTTTRGRQGVDPDPIGAGTCSITLDNTDGRFDPDNTAGPYYGYIRPMRRLRILATANGTQYALFSGYVDAWQRTWPNGSDESYMTVTATDRFKLLARRTNTGSTVQEQADSRLTAILEAGGGSNVIVPSTQRSINPDGFACRTLIGYAYSNTNTLQNCQDVALADGGQFFVDPLGVVVFQSVKYRQAGGNTRATTVQATLGTPDTAIPVLGDLNPSVDETLMANRVKVTAGNGTVYTQDDTTNQGLDGLLELDLGSTLLRTLDCPDRAADVLALRKDPKPRFSRVSVDVLTLAAAADQEKVVAREISDRIAIAIKPPGLSAGTSRQQFIEGITHAVTVAGGQAWTTTFAVSDAGAGATAI